MPTATVFPIPFASAVPVTFCVSDAGDAGVVVQPAITAAIIAIASRDTGRIFLCMLNSRDITGIIFVQVACGLIGCMRLPHDCVKENAAGSKCC